MRSRINSVLSLSVAFGVLSVAAMAARPAAAEAPVTPPVFTWFGGEGFVHADVETGYTLNFNQPESGENSFVYNGDDGQFLLNLADVKFGKMATTKSRTGFFVRIIDGEVALSTFDDSGMHFLEAYGTMLVPLGGKDIKVDAGQFVTHIGYETIETGSNNFYSRSYLFSIPEPVFNQGVRASVPLSGASTLGLYLYNEFNGANDVGNREPAPGFSYAYAPNSRCSVTLNGLTSRERAFSSQTESVVGRRTSILNLIAMDQFNPKFKGVVEGVYRFGEYDHFVPSDNEDLSVLSRQTSSFKKTNYAAYGVAVYGIMTMANTDTIAIRAETFSVDKSDSPILQYPNSADSSKKPTIGSVSLSYEPVHWMKNYPNLRTLFEVRNNFAGKKFFEDKHGNNNKKSETAISIGEIYSF